MVARRAHNPEVVGSNPAPAPTNENSRRNGGCFLLVEVRERSKHRRHGYESDERARWVSELKTVRRTVFRSGVAQSANFGVRRGIASK